MKKKLSEYKEKRDFGKTKEPKAALISDEKKKTKEKGKLFVLQRHDATRLHFDFRLEDSGVLKSWAVPKGMPKDPSEKRLAIQTEDHPLSYANFEGTIPKGSYGAGSVKIFDKGRFVNITIKEGKVMPLKEAIGKGHFLIWLKGGQFEGGFAFTRIDGKNWILVRMRDEKEEKPYPKIITIQGKDIEITNPQKKLYENITKGDLVLYYKRIAPLMLPHIKDRAISMYRFPDGVDSGFYQKNIPDYFPKWISKAEIGKVNYVVIENEAGIVYLANQVSAIHLSSSSASSPDYPDKMIFDLDPSKKDLELLKNVAKSLKKFLGKLGFAAFIMTTGGKGYHIAVPIEADSTFDEVRDFAGKIAGVFARSRPNVLTTELRLDRREDMIFVDVNRNSSKQTAIAPYSVRALPGLTIAYPFKWKDLDTTDPKTFNISSNIQKDAWKDFFSHKVSIKKVVKKLRGG